MTMAPEPLSHLPPPLLFVLSLITGLGLGNAWAWRGRNGHSSWPPRCLGRCGSPSCPSTFEPPAPTLISRPDHRHIMAAAGSRLSLKVGACRVGDPAHEGGATVVARTIKKKKRSRWTWTWLQLHASSRTCRDDCDVSETYQMQSPPPHCRNLTGVNAWRAPNLALQRHAQSRALNN